MTAVRYNFAFLCIALVFAVAGCGSATPVPPSQLVQPAKRCVVAPERLSKLQPGEDLVPAYASVVRSYGRETSKLRCLQRWVKAVGK